MYWQYKDKQIVSISSHTCRNSAKLLSNYFHAESGISLFSYNAEAVEVFESRRSDVRRHQGFSLIELLVSISVLLILVGIMLPALHSAMRGSATLVRCSINLSQINIALQGYLGDNQAVLPTANYHPFAKVKNRVPLNVTLRKYFSDYKGVEIVSPDHDIRFWICAADPIRDIRIKPNSLSTSYVYPLGRGMYDSVQPKLWLLRTTFPLLADSDPYHLERYDGYQKPIMVPAKKKGNDNSPQWDFDFPAGHNRLRVDGSITSGTNVKRDKP